MEYGTHGGLFFFLFFFLSKSLDPNSKTVLISSPTLRCILNLWWRRGDEVRVFTAHIQKSRTLAVFWSKGTKPIPDINKTCSISDDSTIVTLIVRHALIAKRLGVICTILEICVYFNCGFVNNLLCRFRNIVIRI